MKAHTCNLICCIDIRQRPHRLLKQPSSTTICKTAYRASLVQNSVLGSAQTHTIYNLLLARDFHENRADCPVNGECPAKTLWWYRADRLLAYGRTGTARPPSHAFRERRFHHLRRPCSQRSPGDTVGSIRRGPASVLHAHAGQGAPA